jgi:hypothetical protein
LKRPCLYGFEQHRALQKFFSFPFEILKEAQKILFVQIRMENKVRAAFLFLNALHHEEVLVQTDLDSHCQTKNFDA